VTARAGAGRRVLLDTSVVIAPPGSGLSSIADLVAVSAIAVAELELDGSTFRSRPPPSATA
jgi:hypothetical protein